MIPKYIKDSPSLFYQQQKKPSLLAQFKTNQRQIPQIPSLIKIKPDIVSKIIQIEIQNEKLILIIKQHLIHS